MDQFDFADTTTEMPRYCVTEMYEPDEGNYKVYRNGTPLRSKGYEFLTAIQAEKIAEELNANLQAE
jgi:hypothetical protein